MSTPPLVPSPLYGLRTWTVAGEPGSERLAAPQRGTTWPAGGAWLEAECDSGHECPSAGCGCGIHAWHPRPRWARRVLGARRQIRGVVEASGAIEVHEDGFRAQRARPYALVQAVGGNPALVRRLAAAYGVPVIEARRPSDLLAWCAERGLGLDESVVAELLGPAAGTRRRERARRTRSTILRLTAVAAAVGALLLLGIARDPKGDRTLYGRTGPIHVHH
jgi:hypothetical protein